MDERAALTALAGEAGVLTHHLDGLNRPVEVPVGVLIRVCAALGAEISSLADAPGALAAWRASRRRGLPPVLVAWDGTLMPLPAPGKGPGRAQLRLENGDVRPLQVEDGLIRPAGVLPLGRHRLEVQSGAETEVATVIAAPTVAWRRPGSGRRSWGVGAHLAALRSRRSRSVGDLRDLESLCRWVGARGGDLVTVLPLLPTFNGEPPEPSPYAPVSRLFWSELVLEVDGAAGPPPAPDALDVRVAAEEVRAALAGRPLPDRAALDAETLRYARFRGAQARLGRNWRTWPVEPRSGRLAPEHIDRDEERFHLIAQSLVREQLGELAGRLDAGGVRLGLDLAVGVHPDGYDPWSRQGLFAEGISVGAPPDPGFPSGQNWGFAPVLPEASRLEGHRYLASSVEHQAELAGVLRVDHAMALSRLYWIPQGCGLDEGAYVRYPTEELLAILTLASHRHRCEIIGENLGTVPPVIDEALPRHGIRGMFLAEFEAMSAGPRAPSEDEVASIGSHDTPTLAGWIGGVDIGERVRCGLLKAGSAPAEREARSVAVRRLSELVGAPPGDREALLSALLEWLGSSASPLVIAWIEDLWLEEEQVNLPGTRSSERPNWQRPMSRTLDEALSDPAVDSLARRLDAARTRSATRSLSE